MPLRRLLSLFTSNPHVIESLSETKFMRRAAQITVGLYQRLKAGNFFKFQSESGGRRNFLNTFKEELSKEHNQMKRDGKL